MWVEACSVGHGDGFVLGSLASSLKDADIKNGKRYVTRPKAKAILVLGTVKTCQDIVVTTLFVFHLKERLSYICSAVHLILPKERLKQARKYRPYHDCAARRADGDADTFA